MIYIRLVLATIGANISYDRRKLTVDALASLWASYVVCLFRVGDL